MPAHNLESFQIWTVVSCFIFEHVFWLCTLYNIWPKNYNGKYYWVNCL